MYGVKLTCESFLCLSYVHICQKFEGNCFVCLFSIDAFLSMERLMKLVLCVTHNPPAPHNPSAKSKF